VKIVSTVQQIASIIPNGIHFSEIMINHSPCASANDAVQKLNAFIGSFKGGGGGVSPDYNLLENKPSINGIELIGDVEIDTERYKAGRNVEIEDAYGNLWINVDGVDGVDDKVNIADIVDALDSSDTQKPLSANMGKELKVMVDAANGSGGFIPPNDFGTATPTQQSFTDYAMNYIFGADAANHDPTELFNGTKVQNLNDYRVWQLANTPNTTPSVFTWEAALVISEAQRNFTANPIVTNEITDNSVTDAKLGSRTLTDATAASTLPATGMLTAILQTVRNCLKWLAAQFDTGTGHSHNGTDSRKVSYSDLNDKPTIPAAQVNSDWNATSGVAQVLNKPNPIVKTAEITGIAFAANEVAAITYSNNNPTVLVFYTE
jgi:hypothetical protein